MKLLVMGATRGIGRALLDQALSAGHEVTALVRNPQTLDLTHPQLRVVSGSALDAQAVAQALQGQDAVVYTVGTRPSRQAIDTHSSSTRVLLAAMKQQGVNRVVVVTGIGAGDSKGHGGFLYDRLIQPLLLKTMYEDKDRQEALLQACGLDWTIVRPGFLGNGPLKGTYRVVQDLTGITARKVSRADVAAYLLKAVQERLQVRQTVLVD